jgi:hypothetical protein
MAMNKHCEMVVSNKVVGTTPTTSSLLEQPAPFIANDGHYQQPPAVPNKGAAENNGRVNET